MAASAPDFSDVDSFVQSQGAKSGEFDDIDSFVAGQTKGAPAPYKAPTAVLPPYDWQRAILGGLTDIFTGSSMPSAEVGPGYQPLGEQVAGGVRKMETPGQRASGALDV